MIYRAEHPKPQLLRSDWENLNGLWEFEFDFSNSGASRGMHSASFEFSKKINVPFCPESTLSGIGYTDFINSVWYRRKINIPEDKKEGRIFLHFGAVDHKATVYINGKAAFEHIGGYSSFSFEITDFVEAGENIVTVHAEDDTRSPNIPSGKQSEAFESHGCFYTRTTGIWQTVWLEFTPKNYIKSVKYLTDVNAKTVTVQAELVGSGRLEASAFYEGRPMGCASVEASGNAILTLTLDELYLWEVGKGRLYDIVFSFGGDRVESYFGMRSVGFDGYRFMLNNKSVFMRLVLDQGFYPDGIYTAPSDKELEGDIDRSMACGFNGARLHEKVFEERFLYHCDRKGYIVWGEYASWGLDITNASAVAHFLPEWLEILKRDFNHPSIIGWCPFNETWDVGGRRQCDDVLRLAYLATKAYDQTRPCIDTSGNYHVMTDVFDLHDYDASGDAIRSRYERLLTEHTLVDKFSDRQVYDGKKPVFISEYGGIGYMLDNNGWGYGNIPTTESEFLTRLKDVTDAIMDNKALCGFCYTQLTDVEQECNGLYTYSRLPKFDLAKISAIFGRVAEIEKN
jgi:beta-galactosidase/beta-glucuronidase